MRHALVLRLPLLLGLALVLPGCEEEAAMLVAPEAAGEPTTLPYCQSNAGSNGGQTSYQLDQISLNDAAAEASRYQVEVGGSFHSYRGWLGLVFHFQDDSNYYAILFYSGGPGTAWLEFWTFLNGRWRIEASSALAIDPSAWNRLGATVDGDRFQFSVNGELGLEAVDPTLTSGRVGLYTENVAACFDDWIFSAGPGESGGAPGTAVPTPGRSEDAEPPGKAGTAPGLSGSTPGRGRGR